MRCLSDTSAVCIRSNVRSTVASTFATRLLGLLVVLRSQPLLHVRRNAVTRRSAGASCKAFQVGGRQAAAGATEWGAETLSASFHHK